MNYRCQSGHKWKSKKWPVSNWFSSQWFSGEDEPTSCPVCGDTILMCQSTDGKQGAMHMDFKEKLNGTNG